MRNMQNWMLGIALVAGTLGVGNLIANAVPLQDQREYAEGYIPACPGPGYIWVAGYYNAGYWVPGTWVFRGRQDWDRNQGFFASWGWHRDRDRGYRYDGDRRDHRDRGYDRDWDRHRGRDFGREQGRGYDRDHHNREEFRH